MGQLDEIRSVLEQCIPAVISQSAETLLLPVLMGISLQVRTMPLGAHVLVPYLVDPLRIPKMDQGVRNVVLLDESLFMTGF